MDKESHDFNSQYKLSGPVIALVQQNSPPRKLNTEVIHTGVMGDPLENAKLSDITI